MLKSFVDGFNITHRVNALQVVIILPCLGNIEGKRMYNVQNQCNSSFLNILYVRLVESMDAEPTDVGG